VARLTLLAQIMKEPCFTQLRTREQLGYIVASGLHLTWVKSMVAGLSFRVLSKTHGPEEILARVESFLPQFRNEILAKLTPEAFAQHKTSLVTNLLEPPKRLSSEVGVHWAEVVNETREWKRHQLYADAVEATTLEELLELYDTVVMKKETRRKLTVMVHGNKHPMPPTTKTEVESDDDKSVVYLTEKDWLAFRASRPLFPCSPTPFKAKY
jgi:insulysin